MSTGANSCLGTNLNIAPVRYYCEPWTSCDSVDSRPEIFNTDQEAQFTSTAFTDVLKGAGVAISMDGKGRWVDNVSVERLWRSVKYEEVHLHAYEGVAAARAGLGRYFRFYNAERRHQGLGRQTPDEVYSMAQGSVKQGNQRGAEYTYRTVQSSGPTSHRRIVQALLSSFFMGQQWLRCTGSKFIHIFLQGTQK